VTRQFSGQLLKMDTATDRVDAVIDLPPPTDQHSAPATGAAATAMPQDVRLGSDGTHIIGHLDTGVGAHGIYPSRYGRLLYVSNRGRTATLGGASQPGEGSTSVIDPTTDRVTTTWPVPGGGSPDMGGVSADGTQLWLSGRYDSVVDVFDTATGALTHKIHVPAGPHGLCLFPQPGRFSLGHTGNYR
jgi:DNA-binding beta-propeller fold protein YncE